MSHLYYTKDQFGRDNIVAEKCAISGGPWSNFAGREVKDPKTGAIYNAEGVRNFTFIVDNEEDIELLQNEYVNVKRMVNDLPGDEDGIVEARVRAKVRIDNSNPPLRIWLRSGVKDETGAYVEKFKPFNVNRIAELDKLSFETADFTFGVSRKNATHALYLNQAWLTTVYSPNPLEMKYAGMYDEDGSADPAVSTDDEEMPF